MATHFWLSSGVHVLGIMMLVGACSPQNPKVQGPVSAQTPAVSAPEAIPVETTEAGQDSVAKAFLPIVDPACLDTIAWVSEPEASDIALTGCRDASLVPVVDGDGWRTFESPEGHSIKTRGETRDQSTGLFSVEVIYRSGGTFSGKYKISGTPDAQNVLKIGQFTVDALN